MKAWRDFKAAISRLVTASQKAPSSTKLILHISLNHSNYQASTKELILSFNSLSEDERAKFQTALGHLTVGLLRELMSVLNVAGSDPYPTFLVLNIPKVLSPVAYDRMLAHVSGKLFELTQKNDKSIEWASIVLSKALLGIHPSNNEPASYLVGELAARICDEAVRVVLAGNGDKTP